MGMLILMITLESLSGVVQGFLNPILPALGPVFSISDATINGIFLLSNTSFAVLTPLISRMGDRFGYRKVLLFSTIAVSVGVFLMCFIPSLTTVLIGVVLITCVVGFIPLMMGIMRLTQPEQTRRGVSYLIGTLMVMVGAGGLLSGIMGVANPLFGFWLGIPFAIAGIVCAFLLPEVPTPAREPMALAPMACCLIGLVLFISGLSMAPNWGWLSPLTLISLAVGIVLLLSWIRQDSRESSDVRRFTDLRMLKLRSIRSVSTATFFFGFASISYFGTNGIYMHADPAKAGYGFGFSTMGIATVLAVTSVLSFASSLGAGNLMSRTSERMALTLSGLVLAAGFIIFLTLGENLAGYLFGFSLFNLALGAYQSATRSLSVEGVPVAETSSAAGINELALSVGIACGGAVIKMLSSAHTSESGAITPAGIHWIWAVLAVAALFAAVAGSRYPHRAFRVPEIGKAVA